MTKVVLIGPPGSGKSTVGRALSKLMGISFSDTDALIEAEAGKKISEIFVDDGEAHFRELEVAVVTKALVEETGVLALGGGSVMSELSRQAISQSGATVVYLEVGIAQAAPRIGFNTERPMLLVNPRQKWLSLMQERAPIYTALADLTFSTDSKKPYQVAEEILAALKADR
jgi:shikimate kinase